MHKIIIYKREHVVSSGSDSTKNISLNLTLRWRIHLSCVNSDPAAAATAAATDAVAAPDTALND